MKKSSLLLTFILLISLSGCKNEVEIPEEQNDIIAEYIAGKILEYDKYYESNLVKPSTEEETQESGNTIGNEEEINTAETNVPTDNNTDNKPSQESNSNVTQEVVYKDLSEVLKYKNFSVKYKGYVLTDNYPENSDSYFTLISAPGKKKLVAKFTFANTTDKEIHINLAEENIQFQLITENGTTLKPELGLLMNDIRYLDVNIKKNGTYEAVVVFDVDEKINVKGLNLIVTRGSDSAKFKMS